MRVLGIDTSGPRASVALVEAGEVLAEERLREGSRASREALPAIERVLRRAGLPASALDAFAAVRGPGSFTGLRVGLATARGLALATGRPAAGLCALDLLAVQAPCAAADVRVWIDAGRGGVYEGVYRRVGAGWERQGEYRWLPPAAALALGGESIFLGSGAERYRELIESSGGRRRVAPHRAWLAAEAARQVARDLARAGELDPQTLRPLYIRPSQAERVGAWKTPSTSSA